MTAQSFQGHWVCESAESHHSYIYFTESLAYETRLFVPEKSNWVTFKYEVLEVLEDLLTVSHAGNRPVVTDIRIRRNGSHFKILKGDYHFLCRTCTIDDYDEGARLALERRAAQKSS